MLRYLVQALIAIATPCLLASTAVAEICLYQDADGRMTYSNVTEVPPKGAKKVRCFEEAKPPQSATAPRPSAAGRSDAFPQVEGETQSRRDDERRRILESELSSEEQRLETARKALAEQEAVRDGNEQNYQRFLDRIQPYRETAANHERNIEAIKQELSKLR
ncbi:MAG: DUF4124 domain-containing protein [Burkholderiales bacterium]